MDHSGFSAGILVLTRRRLFILYDRVILTIGKRQGFSLWMNIPLVLLGFSRVFELMVSRFAEFSIAGRDLHVAHALLALDVATPVELALAPDDDNGDDDIMVMMMILW